MNKTKYAQGRLKVVLFGEAGEKLKEKTLKHDNFVRAVRYCDKKVAKGEARSFSIYRVVYNSLTQKKWEVE